MENLDAVHEEDRLIVRNVVVALQALRRDQRLFSSWTVGLQGPCYVVTAFLLESTDYEVGSRELEMIHDVSPLRVQSVAMGRVGGKHVVRVLVVNKDQPLMLTETQVVHVRKRSRWLCP